MCDLEAVFLLGGGHSVNGQLLLGVEAKSFKKVTISSDSSEKGAEGISGQERTRFFHLSLFFVFFSTLASSCF